MPSILSRVVSTYKQAYRIKKKVVCFQYTFAHAANVSISCWVLRYFLFLSLCYTYAAQFHVKFLSAHIDFGGGPFIYSIHNKILHSWWQTSVIDT